MYFVGEASSMLIVLIQDLLVLRTGWSNFARNYVGWLTVRMALLDSHMVDRTQESLLRNL